MLIVTIKEGKRSLVVTTKDGIIVAEWVMDSGCSFHMCPHKKFFKNLVMKDLGSVQMGDDRPCQILGEGSIVLKLEDGSEFQLNNVRYVPGLKRNLISLGTFESAGYTVSLKNGKAKIINGSRVVLSGTRSSNNIYVLDGQVMECAVSVAEGQKGNSAVLWACGTTEWVT